MPIGALVVAPFSVAARRYDITYNSEVYSFLELRAGLERDGGRFRTDSDTEVILAAFERWEPDALLRINGIVTIAKRESSRAAR